MFLCSNVYMKIAHIVSTYPPYYGGMGNTVFEMAAGLAARGHEVAVFTPDAYESKEIKPRAAETEPEHAPTLQTKIDYAKRLKPSLKYGNAARLPQLRREFEGFDLIHLHYPFFGTANLVRRYKADHPATPLVITYHLDTRAPGWKGLIFKYYSAYWMPKILRSADRLIASSLEYIESSQASALYRENKKKWIGLPFGVDTVRFQPRAKPEALFARHQLDPNLPVILFVGGMDAAHYFKGVPVLLQALLLAKKAGLQAQVVFVGDGELRESYQLSAISSDVSVRSPDNKRRGYQLTDGVRFVGYVSDEELPLYYNLADLFVLPSINCGEAFGMVLLEAMASGIPVVGSNLPGVRAVARDGGLTVEPNNPTDLAEAIRGFFYNQADRAAWRQKARRAAEEKYAWPGIVERLEEIYKSLV